MPTAADDRSLEVLNEVARIATLDLELRPMLQRITDTLARKFDWQFVALDLARPRARLVQCEALTTCVDTSVHVGYSRELGSGVVGEVAATGEPVLIDDVQHVAELRRDHARRALGDLRAGEASRAAWWPC